MRQQCCIRQHHSAPLRIHPKLPPQARFNALLKLNRSTLFYIFLFYFLFFSVFLAAAVSAAPAFDDQYVKAGSSGSGSSWTDARGNIQEAIEAAGVGDSIYVAGGTYTEAISLKSAIALMGGYEGVGDGPGHRNLEAFASIIDGSTARHGEPAFHVVSMNFLSSATLDGFTITGGHANGTEILDTRGGGIFCQGVSPNNRIVNCLITQNAAEIRGGGINLNQSSPTLINCTISDNTTGPPSNPDFDAAGGGAYGWYSNSTFINCTITGNRVFKNVNSYRGTAGGGVNFTYDNQVQFIDCTFHNNQAESGGGINAGGCRLVNCTIYGNTAKVGGGINGAALEVINCTIYGNTAEKGGGAHHNHSFAEKYVNTIFSNNGSYGIYYGSFPDDGLELSNCLFDNNASGHFGIFQYSGSPPAGTLMVYNDPVEIDLNLPGARGSRTGDPLFLNAENGDFHLLDHSAALDRGTTIDAPEIDFEGDPRPGDDGLIDIGVDEADSAFMPSSDSDPPFSTVENLARYSTTTIIAVPYRASDAGSGVAYVELYYQRNNNSGWLQYGTTFTTSPIEFDSSTTGGDGLYAFYIIATDRDGNIETDKSSAEGEISVSANFSHHRIFVDKAAQGLQLGKNWGNAFLTINQALDVAETFDIREIWVAAGTYYEAIRMRNNVHLYGGFASIGRGGPWRDPAVHETIIQAGTSGNIGEKSYHVVRFDNVTNIRLDGFTLTGGSATHFQSGPMEPVILGEDAGGGIYFVDADGTNMVYNCVITGNRAMSFIRGAAIGKGGGVACRNSSPTLMSCVIADNDARWGGGIYISTDSNPTFIACTIEDNECNAITIYHHGGYGGGVHFSGPSEALFLNCSFRNNFALRGGGVYGYSHDANSSPRFLNCIFARNQAFDQDYVQGNWIPSGMGGGAFCSGYFNPQFTNCNIVDNATNHRGGGVVCDGFSRPLIINTILTGNDLYGIFERSVDADPIVEHCLFFGNSQGDYFDETAQTYTGAQAINNNIAEAINNIEGEPKFIDAGGGDYHLRPNSPAIDAGKFVGGLYADFENDPRLMNGTTQLRGDGSDFDIGVDEYINFELIYRALTNQLHRDFLGREAKTKELGRFVADLLDGATTLPEIALQLIENKEHDNVTGFVARCYFGLFNNNMVIPFTHPNYRLPDYGGVVFWRNEMARVIAEGGSLQDAKLYVIRGFLGSPEWSDSIGNLSDAEFVELLYNHILGRQSEDSGRAYHLVNLTGGLVTREELVFLFLESPEAHQRYKPFVILASAYCNLLQRTSDRQGFLYHMWLIHHNWPVSYDPHLVYVSLSAFINSPEYRLRLAALGIFYPRL